MKTLKNLIVFMGRYHVEGRGAGAGGGGGYSSSSTIIFYRIK
jgi:hypothetical protein